MQRTKLDTALQQLAIKRDRVDELKYTLTQILEISGCDSKGFGSKRTDISAIVKETLNID
jgi:hypothetical protein